MNAKDYLNGINKEELIKKKKGSFVCNTKTSNN